MFLKGHFIGVILLSAGIAEFILADQSRLKSQMMQKETERFGWDSW
tara:strand:- start:3437 stop:3574 length:138 start_codon:yes stop_codon:yes gene_type:complete